MRMVSQAGNLFWLCETLLLLFSCKILLNQFIHFGGYPVPIELTNSLPWARWVPASRMCLQCHKQPDNTCALRERHRSKALWQVWAECWWCKWMKTELETAVQQKGIEEHRKGFWCNQLQKAKGIKWAGLCSHATSWSCWESQDYRELQGANPHRGERKVFFKGNGHHLANPSLWELGMQFTKKRLCKIFKIV